MIRLGGVRKAYQEIDRRDDENMFASLALFEDLHNGVRGGIEEEDKTSALPFTTDESKPFTAAVASGTSKHMFNHRMPDNIFISTTL